MTAPHVGGPKSPGHGDKIATPSAGGRAGLTHTPEELAGDPRHPVADPNDPAWPADDGSLLRFAAGVLQPVAGDVDLQAIAGVGASDDQRPV
jgi:hypothetical protein